MNDRNENVNKSGGTEKIWEKTRKTFQAASFEANRYKRLVQKKIDLAALHKKISAGHYDLGKLIDDLRESDVEDIMNTEQVAEMLRRLDGYKHSAATLEEEIETIKAEEASAEAKESPFESPPEEEKHEENR